MKVKLPIVRRLLFLVVDLTELVKGIEFDYSCVHGVLSRS
jgi:hypothetical protein